MQPLVWIHTSETEPKEKLGLDFLPSSGVTVGLKEPSAPPALVIVLAERSSVSELCSWVREIRSRLGGALPILVLSKDRTRDEILSALGSGASEYWVAPFSVNAFSARVQYLLAPIQTGPSRLGGLVFEPEHCRLSRDGAKIQLTNKELQIFSVLYRAECREVARSVIFSEAWRDTRVTPKAFDVHLFNLRRKLTELGLQVRFSPPDRYCLLPK